MISAKDSNESENRNKNCENSLENLPATGGLVVRREIGMLAEITTDELDDPDDENDSEEYAHDNDNNIGCFHGFIVA